MFAQLETYVENIKNYKLKQLNLCLYNQKHMLKILKIKKLNQSNLYLYNLCSQHISSNAISTVMHIPCILYFNIRSMYTAIDTAIILVTKPNNIVVARVNNKFY